MDHIIFLSMLIFLIISDLLRIRFFYLFFTIKITRKIEIELHFRKQSFQDFLANLQADDRDYGVKLGEIMMRYVNEHELRFKSVRFPLMAQRFQRERIILKKKV